MKSSNKLAFEKYRSFKWPVIPLCHPDHQHMSEDHLASCPNPGKRPLVKGWPQASVPEQTDIDRWLSKWPNANIGLVLGSPSGMVAIDVDGDSGRELLERMSESDLPETVSFSTPNGMRYLYQIPEGMVLRKHSVAATNEAHAECALLGEASLTVLPPSVHASGKSYLWVNHPDEIELAAAPDWMVHLMSKSDNHASAHPATNTGPVSETIQLLAERCQRFRQDWDTQKIFGLPEESWFRWCKLLVNATGEQNTATLFSSVSTKHNKASQDRIAQLYTEKTNAMLRCSTFGCEEEQIASCFGKLRTNDVGKPTNSPGSFLKSRRIADAGFTVEPKTQKITGLNGNVFAEYVLRQRLDLLFLNVGDGHFYEYQAGLWHLLNSNELTRKTRKILHEFVPNFWTPRQGMSLLDTFRVATEAASEMDDERQYLNLENGLLNLNTLEMEPHRKEVRSTIRIPIHFDEKADCPTFERYLDEVFSGDRELADLVGEMFGYCLTTEVKAQKAFLLYGKGKNGKSALADVLMALVGEQNTSALSLSELERPFASSELVGKLLNLATENEIGGSGLNTEMFKRVATGEPIRVERKHEQGYLYRPYCKLVLAVNNLPYSKDKSFGFSRRIIIVPFERTFEESEADPDLPDKLKLELPGVLNFALRGLERLRENRFRFTKSEASDRALKQYTDLLNPVQCFVEEAIEGGTAADKMFFRDLYKAFKDWAYENGHESLGKTTQGKLVNNVKDILNQKKVAFELTKSGGERGLKGVRLKFAPKKRSNRWFVESGETECTLDDL